MIAAVLAWWRRRGVRACASGRHAWRRCPPPSEVDFVVAGLYDWARCARCGVVGNRVYD